MWLKKYNFTEKGDFLRDLTSHLKGFDYYNWYTKNDFKDFHEKLKNAFKPKEKKVAKSIIIDGENLTIGLNESETPMGKVLKNKLKADIKNMGMTLEDDEKRKILLEILLDV